MRKFVYLLLLVIVSACSSDENNSVNGEGSISGNGQSYEFDRAYVTNDGENVFTIHLSKGNLTYDESDLQYSYADNLDRILLIRIGTNATTQQLPPGTYVNGDTQTWLFSNFLNDIQTFNGEVTDSNLIFDNSAILPEQGQLIITRHSDNEYTFGYNFITSVGQFNGSYSGQITKLNY